MNKPVRSAERVTLDSIAADVLELWQRAANEPERGQTTLETIRNDIAQLASAIVFIAQHVARHLDATD